MGSDKLVNNIIIITIFVLVFSVWCICVCLWLIQYTRRLRAVQQKLGIGPQKLSHESNVLKLWSDAQRQKARQSPSKSLLQRLELLKDSAGWKASLLTIVTRLLYMTVLAFALTYLLSGELLLAGGVAVVLIFLFWGYMQKCISRHTVLFERQFADALGIASRALRAGHPLIGTFQLISEEIGDPLGTIFGQICQQQALGMDFKDSIRQVADTTYSPELKLFATSIAIQFQSGGNLAELMDRLSEVIRARMRLNRRIRVITAQTQLSKKILIALPLLLFVVLKIINPQYMEPFTNTDAGRYMLAIGATSLLFGTWIMNRISVVRF